MQQLFLAAAVAALAAAAPPVRILHFESQSPNLENRLLRSSLLHATAVFAIASHIVGLDSTAKSLARGVVKTR